MIPLNSYLEMFENFGEELLLLSVIKEGEYSYRIISHIRKGGVVLKTETIGLNHRDALQDHWLELNKK